MAKDAPAVRRLAWSRKIAHTTHWLFLPYSEKKARRWIAATADHFAMGNSMEFGIQLKSGGELAGLVGLDHVDVEDVVALALLREEWVKLSQD
jgi:hypothetical protein